eukprot:1195635-Prorocentrum_minimum.AAC.1
MFPQCEPIARGGRIFPQCEPIAAKNQSREGREDIPVVRTNRVRGGRICGETPPSRAARPSRHRPPLDGRTGYGVDGRDYGVDGRGYGVDGRGYGVDGRGTVIACSLDGEVRGYLPPDVDARGQMMDANTEEESIAELSQRKQELLYELQSYEKNMAIASNQAKRGGDDTGQVRRHIVVLGEIWVVVCILAVTGTGGTVKKKQE